MVSLQDTYKAEAHISDSHSAMEKDNNPSDDEAAKPSEDASSQTNWFANFFKDYEKYIEEERQIWTSPEVNQLFEAILNSKDEADREIKEATQKLKAGLEKEWADYNEWKELFASSETTASNPEENDSLDDLLQKPYRLAQGRIRYLRIFLNTIKIEPGSQAPRREVETFAQQQLADTLATMPNCGVTLDS